MILISLAVWLVRKTRRLAAAAGAGAWPRCSGHLGPLWVAVMVGTLVTGSGPHAGDAGCPATAWTACC